jgi:integration host factor subunit beta
MNKSGLIDQLQRKTGISKAKAEKVVDIFFGTISETLSQGDRVEIRGFCSIFVKNYRGYTGRNPKTGAKVEIPPKKLPFFKCGKELKDRVDHQPE